MKRKIVWFLFIMLLITVGAYAYKTYSNVSRTLEDIYTPVDHVKSEKIQVKKSNITQHKPISLLIFGVDGIGKKGARSDTIMVMTLNPATHSTKIVSIPRDTYTSIVGKGKKDKINHAYAYGGPKMAIDTVKQFLDIPIDYFVTIDMQGFTEVIDLLGGVTVNNPFAFQDKGYSFPKGEITLNGKKALVYARMRKQDPRGDLGRIDRQKDIVEAVLKKGIGISTIPKINELLAILRGNVQTNVSPDEVSTLIEYYKLTHKNIEKLELKGQNYRMNGIWYFFVREQDRMFLSKTLQQHLKAAAP